MIIKYATKRDRNGNRRYLCVNHDARTYAEEPRHWYCREEFVEVSVADMRKLKDATKEAGYTPVSYM